MYASGAFNICDMDVNKQEGTFTPTTIYGKMGRASGRNVWGQTTTGVALSYGQDLVDYSSPTNYVIVTDSGIRLQANGWTEEGHSDNITVVEWSSHNLTVTPNGVFVDGKSIGSGSATWG